MSAGTATAARGTLPLHLLMLGRVAVLAAFVGAWWVAPESIIPSSVASRPPDVAAAAWQWVVDGTFVEVLRVSLGSLVIGLTWGAVAGILLGAFSYFFPTLGESIRPIMGWFNAVPKVAFIGVLVVLFGLTQTTSVTLTAAFALMIFYYYTMQGIRAVDSVTRDCLTLMGASRAWITWNALMPSALVYILAALRVALPMGFSAVVFSEIMMGSLGLGALIALNAYTGNAAAAMAGTGVTAVIGFGLDLVVRKIEERANRWRTTVG